MRLATPASLFAEQLEREQKLSRGAKDPMSKPDQEQVQWLDRMSSAYVSHADSVLRFAYYLTSSRVEAEDILQDSFLRVFAKPRRLQTDAEIGAYLHRTAINLVRTRSRRARVLGMIRRSQAESEQPASNVDDRDHVWRHLKALPYRQKAVLFFKHYEGLSEREVAERLDCTVEAVRSLAHRGMNSLRKEMADGGS